MCLNGPLTLTVPVNNQADLYPFSRALDMHCLGAVPAGEGVLEKSSNLLPHPALTGHFVPVVFVGDYDHGLFWMAETDRGWNAGDGDEQVTLVRENGQLMLKFHLFASSAILDQPRTIEFAFVATPTRPKAIGYRQAFMDGKHTHDTAGFRFYGGGVNGLQHHCTRSQSPIFHNRRRLTGFKQGERRETIRPQLFFPFFCRPFSCLFLYLIYSNILFTAADRGRKERNYDIKRESFDNACVRRT